MKTVFKRLISSLLLVVMLVAALPVSMVSAASADIDWEYLKDKYGLTDSQIDAAKDIADDYGLTQEQVDAVEEYYDTLTPEEQDELKEAVKNGEITSPDDLPGTESEKFVKAMFIATMKQAAKDLLNRFVEAMEGVTVKNPFDVYRVYDENGNLAGVNFALQAADEVEIVEAVKGIVENYDVLSALKMMAGAVLLFDEVSVNGYTVYDLADPSDIRNALVQIYRANPIEFSTIANMEGNTLATYNFSLSCRGVEINVPVNFVIECSEATLNKIKSAAAKLADIFEVNGDFSEDDGIFSADLEGIVDASDYVDNILKYLLPAAVADNYALVRDQLHTMTLGDLLEQVKLERLQYVAEKLGYGVQFEKLVNKIADHFHLSLEEPNDLKALIDVIDEKNLLSVYAKAIMQKAVAVRTAIANADAADLKNALIALDKKLQVPASVKMLLVQAYGANADLVSISATKLKEMLLELEAKIQLPADFVDTLKNAISIQYIQNKMNKTVGSFYNGDGSYSFAIGNGIGPKGFYNYAEAILDRLLSTKLEDRISKALKAHGYASVEDYVEAAKARYNKLYTGKYDLDMNFTLVLFDVYTVTFVDEKGNVLDTQKVVAGDSAEDPYYHGGSVLGVNYSADKSYENVLADMTVVLTRENHKLDKVEIIKEPTCDTDGLKNVYCSIEGCDYAELNVLIPAHDHELIVDEYLAPDCENPGYIYQVCKYCGILKNEVLDALGHIWVVDMEVLPNACEDGYRLSHCERCGEVKREKLPGGDHDLVAGTPVAPTCTEDGYTPYTCTVCGEVFNLDIVPKLGHNIYHETVQPDCTEDGYAIIKCLNGCGIDEKHVIPALGHLWDDGVVTTDPTCTDPGVKTTTCLRCRETKTEEIPALGHNLTEFIGVMYPNTCIHYGVDTYFCDRCFDFVAVATNPDGVSHSFEHVDGKAATCTQPGYDSYVCRFCGMPETVIIPALGHAYDLDNGVFVAPTCTTEGSWTYTCLTCGDTKVVIIPKTGHVYKPVHTEGFNCHNPSYDENFCINCGESGGIVNVTDIYYPPLRNYALNIAFIDDTLIVKIDRMTVGEFKTNFTDPIIVYKNQEALDAGEAMADEAYVGTGCIVVCGVCGEEFNVAVIADINGDGKVNSIDYMYVKRHVRGNYVLSGIQKVAADVNVDVKVSALDYARVKAHVMYRYDVYENFPAWESIKNTIYFNTVSAD